MFCFFFQAEDGIRDRNVTGVQTCALPISPLATAAGEVWPSDQLWKPLAAPMFATYSDAGGFWNALGDGEAAIEDLREPLERLKTITEGYVLDGWQSTEDAQTTTLLVNGQTIMATSSAGIGRLHDIGLARKSLTVDQAAWA